MFESSEEAGLAVSVVVICAYCGQVRTPLGDWRATAPDLSQEFVSHGCCPECFEREMAKCRVRIAAAGWRARRW
jgi:hypothetical protein